MTDTDYSTEVTTVVNALNAVYENKQANKKNSLSGDYSSDDESYPTCQAVKGAYGTRVTSWQAYPSDSNIPSELLVKSTINNLDADDIAYDNQHSVEDILDEYGSAIGAKASKTNGAGEITDSNAANYTNIGTFTSSSKQSDINSALNTIIGTLKGTKFIEIVDTLPIPSEDTMGKLYIISETESGVAKVNVYYTKQTGTGSSAVYAMVKMDANILDSLSWNDISDKPSFGTSHNNFAYGDHGHGEISNGGAVTTTVDMATSGTADKILIADASDNNKVKATSQVLVTQIKNTSPTISGIGGNLNTQAEVNSAIGEKLRTAITPARLVKYVPSLAPASAETMGQLYVVPYSTSQGTYNNYKVYVTIEDTTGSTSVYTWERLDNGDSEVKAFASQLAEAINPSS